jgi:hypothetical protein
MPCVLIGIVVPGVLRDMTLILCLLKYHNEQHCNKFIPYVGIIIRFQKNRPSWDFEKLYAQRQRVQETLGEKLCAIECESGNAEAQCNIIKE